MSISLLGESTDLWETAPKRRGHLEFTIHKDPLTRCYEYHDYDSPVDDGGFYYTYHLARHPIERADAAHPEKPGD